MASSSSRLSLLVTASALALAIGAGTAVAGMDEARRYVDTEFQPSTLSKEDQLKEMEWFVNAA
ncbi:MAG: extracellular solute-binding protein, partial [Microvirga sp.]|nr:extracellular solute-binding protein [Microvirga sp.]